MATNPTPAANPSATAGESKSTAPAADKATSASVGSKAAPAAPASTPPADSKTSSATNTPTVSDSATFGSMLDDLAGGEVERNGGMKTEAVVTQAAAPAATPASAEPGTAASTAKPAPLPSAPAFEDDSHRFKTNAELRNEFYARTKALKERETELARLRSELETAKAPREDDEKKAIAERLAKAEQELSKREMELRHANYLKSNEYREKFEKPFNDTLAEAYAAVGEFSVTDENGNARQLNDKDFMTLLNLPRQQAWEVAGKLFGQAAPEIMGYRNKLKEITNQAQGEAKRYREQGEAQDKDAMAAQAAQRERLKAHWKTSNEKLAKQYPDFFAPDEKDPEGNEWLQKGFEYVDRVFSAGAMTPEQRIEHEADVRNRAAGFGRLAYRLKKEQELRKAAEEELAGYRASTPKRGERDGAGSPTPVEETFASEIDKIASGRS